MTDRRQSTALEVARTIADFHEHSPAGQVRILRVLVDGQSELPSYLFALATELGGYYVDSGRSPVASHRGQAPPAPLVAGLTTALTVPDAWAPRTLTVDTADGIQVGFAELGQGVPGSDAEAKLLGLGSALLDPALLESSFAVVAYSESGMANPFRQAAWGIGSQLNGLTLSNLRTLVLIAEIEGDPDVRLHCTFESGFTLGHLNGRVVRRHEPDRLGLMTARFANSTGPLVLYIGAGFSVTSGLPLGNSLRDSTMRLMLGAGAQDAVGLDLARRFRAAQQGLLTQTEQDASDDEFERDLTFERVVGMFRQQNQSWPPQTLLDLQERCQTVLTNEPSTAVRQLRAIIRSGFRLVIFTVNLDQLIESDVADAVHVFASEQDFDQAAEYVRRYIAGEVDRVPVLKLHGTIEDLDTCVVTKEQTEAGLPEGKRNAILATVDGHGATWIYVGASMRDLDVNRDLQRTEMSVMEEFWVNPTMSETIETFARSREPRWSKSTIPERDAQSRLISETAGAFFDSFATEIARRSGGSGS